MSTSRTVLIGAGGHAKVVIDTLRLIGVRDRSIQLCDERPEAWGRELLGIKITPLTELAACTDDEYHICIGDCSARKRLYIWALAKRLRPKNIFHPHARISKSAVVGDGVFAAAGAIIGPEATISNGGIVNHGAIVDHDCVVGEFCHIAPGAILGGAVRFGERVFAGAGSIVLPGVAIGNGVVLGAGSVVLKNVSDDRVVIGIPAQDLTGKQRDRY